MVDQNLICLFREYLTKERFLLICDHGKYPSHLLGLIKHMRWMKENDIEIDALSIRNTSKSRAMLIDYMQTLDAVDRKIHKIK